MAIDSAHCRRRCQRAHWNWRIKWLHSEGFWYVHAFLSQCVRFFEQATLFKDIVSLLHKGFKGTVSCGLVLFAKIKEHILCPLHHPCKVPFVSNCLLQSPIGNDNNCSWCCHGTWKLQKELYSMWNKTTWAWHQVDKSKQIQLPLLHNILDVATYLFIPSNVGPIQFLFLSLSTSTFHEVTIFIGVLNGGTWRGNGMSVTVFSIKGSIFDSAFPCLKKTNNNKRMMASENYIGKVR